MELSCSAALLASPLPARPSSAAASLASCKSVLFRNGVSDLSTKRRLSLVSGRRESGGRSTSRGLGCRCLFGLGVPELVVIAGVAALVFGPKKLPEVGRSIGKTVKSFQQAAKEFETELKKEPEAGVEAPAAQEPKSVSGEDEKKELEASGQKESV